jgi:hypothetical protein
MTASAQEAPNGCLGADALSIAACDVLLYLSGNDCDGSAVSLR